jgi:HTH-type transcriptional regulator/antitoxin HigA
MSAPEEARHVPRILAECGVRFVIVEGLGDSEKVDGVSTWLDPAKPVIGMSLRRDRIDNFWFVLRHEIDHVIEKDGLDIDRVDVALEETPDSVGVPEQERRANGVAADFCVRHEEMDSFILRVQPYFSERRLIAFAAKLKVHPGIVAGQLRRRLGRYDLFNKQNARIRSIVTAVATVDGWGQVAPVST